jgi:hypothetical protein
VAGYLMNKPKGLYLSPFRAMRASIARMCCATTARTFMWTA